ncbi:MAG: primosomal protein N' [Dehalococcoidia bacterium]|nr:primosomal protein N' [Dehalococcoidia bacterium]MQG16284.1 primosomal protein N' [SAR202 cluster bacterium]
MQYSEQKQYVEVAVDVPTARLGTFSYSVPDHLNVKPGQLVRVPFGSRRPQGLVRSLVPSPSVPQTRDVISVVDAEPYLDEIHLKLSDWISSNYLSPIFQSISPMLPPGVRTGNNLRIEINPELSGLKNHNINERQQKLLSYISQNSPLTVTQLRKSFGESIGTHIKTLERKGYLVLKPVRESQTVRELKVKHIRLTSDGRSFDISGSNALQNAPKQMQLFESLKTEYDAIKLSVARNTFGDSAVNGLKNKGYIEIFLVVVSRDPLAGIDFPNPENINLTKAQQVAAGHINTSIDSHDYNSFLLQGVTGSGKTEVYINAIKKCISQGRRSIVLVPEIALTHQIISRLASRFPNKVAVLHSGLTPGERYDQWWKIRRGEYPIVVGSRSAIFSPQMDLGLIIIDEEHEWTYKQIDPEPRYHTREVAIKLAKLTNATLVMGSASPDVDTRYRADAGVHKLLVLPDRISRSKQGLTESRNLAEVEIVDIKRELRQGHDHFLSRKLLSSLEDCLGSGSKALLFMNRRGSASFLRCESCGLGVKCRRCDIHMTYHETYKYRNEQKKEALICHHCNNRRNVPDKCLVCKEGKLNKYGVGTQGIASSVKSLFPATKVITWDRDTSKKAIDVQSLLDDFETPGPAVLIGTQIIAKGLHFPEITLVGVVSADLGLSIPDFRASERTFQLICQVAGRAGRGKLPGKVIIQTYQPDNYAIACAASQDFESFYNTEIEYRRNLKTPPFSRMVKLNYSHSNSVFSEKEALRVADFLRYQRDIRGISNIRIMGPTPSYPFKLRGIYRWNINVAGIEPNKFLEDLPLPRGWYVDVDPVGP